MARELVVLGTASQVPTRARNHTGHVLRWDDLVLLLDPGEGTQRQMIYAGVSAPSIQRIAITHAHGDHCLGLPGVLARRALDGAGEPVALHYPSAAQADINALRRAGRPAEPSPVEEHPVEADGVIAVGPSWTLRAAALDHRVPTVGYRLEEPPGVRMLPHRLAAAGVAGPDVGRLRREGSLTLPSGATVTLEQVSEPRPGQVFAFIMDTRWCPGALTLAQGADLLLVESTFLDRDRELAHAFGHLTAAQAGALAAESGALRLVLTHFSRRYGDEPAAFLAEAVAAFDGEVVAAADLDVIAVPRRR